MLGFHPRDNLRGYAQGFFLLGEIVQYANLIPCLANRDAVFRNPILILGYQ